MTSNDLTPQQAEALKTEFGRMLHYLGALQKRMHKRRFPDCDPLKVQVHEAYNAMHKLHTTAHYLSCEHGVGRSARDTGDK